MAPRRRLSGLGPALLLAFGGLYALASVNCCGPWGGDDALIERHGEASGPLQAGAARVALKPALPAVRAGYGPPRRRLDSIAAELSARALVLQSGEVRLGLVVLDVLLVTSPVRTRIQAAVAGADLDSLWVVASHTHSSFGGFDQRPLAQLAGMGRFEQEREDALVAAAAAALNGAAAQLRPVTLERAEADLSRLAYSRSDEGPIDGALTAVRFVGDGGKAVAEWLILSGHPTLVPRGADALDPDYPGRLAQLREGEGSAGVSLVTQGAGGNAAAVADGAPPDGAAPHFAAVLDARVDPLPWKGDAEARLGWAEVEHALPRPDSSRVAPLGFRSIGDNALCVRAERRALLSLWRLGPLTLLAVPAEPTWDAGAELLKAAHADRVVGLANGYLGYVEPKAKVEAGAGEARRQYFLPELLERLVRAAGRAREVWR